MILIFFDYFLVALHAAAIHINTNLSASVLEGDRNNSASCVLVTHVNAIEGKVVELHWLLVPETSQLQERRGLRFAINSTIVAFMPKNSQEMTCVGSTFIEDVIWKEFCPKRMKFRNNQTHLSVEITNLTRDSSFIFNLIHQAQAHDLTCHYHDTIILTVLPLASTSISEQDTIKTKYSTTVEVVPTSGVLSTISANAHETVTPRFPATRISASPKMSLGVHNTVGPSNTLVVPSTVYVTSAGQNTVEPPTPVDTLSTNGQGISEDLPSRGGWISVVVIAVAVLVSIAVRLMLIGLSLLLILYFDILINTVLIQL